MIWLADFRWKQSLFLRFPKSILVICSFSYTYSSGRCQRKLHLTELNKQGNAFKILPVVELNSSERTGRGNFKSWNKLMKKYKNTLEGRLVKLIKPCMFANCCFIEVRTLPSHREQGKRPYLPRWLHFKGMIPKTLKKDIPGLKNKRLRHLHFRGAKKEFATPNFLRGNALRKRRPAAYPERRLSEVWASEKTLRPSCQKLNLGHISILGLSKSVADLGFVLKKIPFRPSYSYTPSIRWGAPGTNTSTSSLCSRCLAPGFLPKELQVLV